MSERRPSYPAEGSGEAEETGGTGEMHRSTGDAYERTWELELLVSGAVVFALLQLPGVLDRWFWRVETHQTGVVFQLVWFAYIYGKVSVYTLAVAFVVHLSARAYWVGLIGLDTAFPRGVIWENLPVGPITRKVYRDRQPSIEALIRRVDRFCNIIFPFAFSLVFLTLMGLGLAGLLGLAAAALTAWVPRMRSVDTYLVFAAVLAFPPAVAALSDKLLAGRLDPSRGFGRVIYRVTSFFYALTAGVSHRPVLNVLTSNVRSRVASAGTALFFIAMFLLVLANMLRQRGDLSFDGYVHLPPEASVEGIDPLYYSEEHGEGALPRRRPSIQAHAVTEPYVRLFIPYAPTRHADAVERECPEVRPLRGRGIRIAPIDSPTDTAAARAVLRCLERLHPITLNGAPVDARFRFYTEPTTRRRGVVTFIPTAALPDTENVLTVATLADPDDENSTPPLHRIPFWVDGGDQGLGTRD